MGRLDGKVALITGAARGQGRAHAIRFAEEGADIVAVDLAAPIASVPYDLASADDLDQTDKAVSALGRRILTVTADVRDQAAMSAAVARAVDTFGRLDIVVANAGIISFGYTWELTEEQWQDVIDVNLTGVFHTVKAAAPAMIAAGNGGSIVLTSSVLGLRGTTGASPYASSKHGVIGLAKSLAAELGPHGIRVNCVNPSNVATEMVLNKTTLGLFRPDLTDPTPEDTAEIMSMPHLIKVPWVDPVDVSNAALFLVSDEARYVTGVVLPVDAGLLAH
jgi:SDR family mycofactocin-dependent oxidoreductase